MGLFTKRTDSGVPFGLRDPANEEQVMSRKLAHIRTPGLGDPGWPGDARTIIPGVSPTFPVTDSPDPYAPASDQMGTTQRNGVTTTHMLDPAREYTMTRGGSQRVAAFSNSLPAARFFQGFANVRWSGIMQGYGLAPRALISPRPLHMGANPGAFGSKEAHRATQYNPFPPMGSIIPKAL